MEDLYKVLAEVDMLFYKPHAIHYFLWYSYQKKKSEGFPRPPSLPEYVLSLVLLSGQGQTPEEASVIYRLVGDVLEIAGRCLSVGDLTCEELENKLREYAEQAEDKEVLEKLTPHMIELLELVSSRRTDPEKLDRVVRKIKQILKKYKRG